MQQYDLFDENLEKKIYRMEKWIGRLQKELWFLKEVYVRTNKVKKINKEFKQLDIFSG